MNQGYIKQLRTTIRDNLVVNIQNLHVRYEDSISNPDNPFAIGVTLESLTYQPCDQYWTKKFITLEDKKRILKSYKIIEVQNFSGKARSFRFN